MNKRIAILVLLFVSLSLVKSSAQDYRYEIGGGLGTSGYLGDVNKSNLFKHPGFAAEFVFRRVFNYRWALKTNLLTAGISGNSADYNDVLPGSQTYKFKSQLYDLGAQMEFNFFNFGIGYTYKKLHRIVPYLSAGLGTTLAVTDGKSAFALNLPFGVGLKYKVNERLNLGCDFTMRKVFGDKIDGFSADDLTGIKSSFFKNTDWYSLLMISVTYEFGKKCKTCHYVE